MKLTICGTPGAGKGTVSKILAKELHLERLSVGDLQREEAARHKMTLLDFLIYCDKNPQLGWDKKFDSLQEELGKKKDNFIFDGRTSFHFIPDAIHIYLSVDFDEAARRVAGDTHRKSEGTIGLEATRKQLVHRYEEERSRFKTLYGIDVHDPANFDIVIDTTHMNIQQCAQAVIDALKKIDTTRKEQ
ncbi:MAG TPA: nucleoside monophosphate kinase [Acidobacteriota bacterium]|nr:nucleoside monophosphate kinase [Acidobacteriota bacterium]